MGFFGLFGQKQATLVEKLDALAVMIGYIIGVGMFGLPYLTSKSGLIPFFILLTLIGTVQYFLHLMYANLIVDNGGNHRLPGYADIYLGRRAKIFTFIAQVIGNYGALLAYTILTGVFMHQLLGPILGGSEFVYGTVIFAAEAVVVLFGVRWIGRSELIMSALMLGVVLMITLKSFGKASITSYTAIDWKNVLLPYGAMLFAVDGLGSIPIVAAILRRDKTSVKSVIRWGTFIPVAVTAAFTLAVVGVTGSGTTPDALSGLSLALKNGVITLSLIFGILCMITSFLGVAESVKETMHCDFRISKSVAWMLAMSVPYMLFLAGMQNFIKVISFAGAVAGGISAIILILIFFEMKRASRNLSLFKHKPANVLLWALAAMFAAGIIYEIYFFL